MRKILFLVAVLAVGCLSSCLKIVEVPDKAPDERPPIVTDSIQWDDGGTTDIVVR